MAQEITKGIKQLVGEARERITELTAEELRALHGDEGVVIVDIRDVRELQRDGKIPGAFHCPRGMLEFWIDPQSPYYKDVFGQDKRYIFYCASGMRSALSADAAQAMGLKPVAHLAGGYKGWVVADGPVEMPEDAD